MGKTVESLGYEVIALDLKETDIDCHIIDWEYTLYPDGYFVVIWASPPCNTFSQMRDCRIGRHGYTRETLQSERDKIGLPSLRKT